AGGAHFASPTSQNASRQAKRAPVAKRRTVGIGLGTGTGQEHRASPQPKGPHKRRRSLERLRSIGTLGHRVECDFRRSSDALAGLALISLPPRDDTTGHHAASKTIRDDEVMTVDPDERESPRTSTRLPMSPVGREYSAWPN